jgi:hypothetical protein
MSRHGAEAHLPISDLAQWMRDTTGRVDDGNTGGLSVYQIVRVDRHHQPLPPIVEEDSPANTFSASVHYAKPGTLTVDDVLRVAEVDPARLRQAALDAILSYAAEGHAEDAVDQHRERIWALHDQILGETVG